MKFAVSVMAESRDESIEVNVEEILAAWSCQSKEIPPLVLSHPIAPAGTVSSGPYKVWFTIPERLFSHDLCGGL